MDIWTNRKEATKKEKKTNSRRRLIVWEIEPQEKLYLNRKKLNQVSKR